MQLAGPRSPITLPFLGRMCATIDIEHWNTQHLYTDNLLKKPWSCMDVLGISWIFHIYIASQQDSCWQRRSTWLCCLWLSRPFLRSALSVGLAGCAWCHQTKMDLFIPTETGMSMISKKRNSDFNGFNQQRQGFRGFNNFNQPSENKISMVSINRNRDFNDFNRQEIGTSMVEYFFQGTEDFPQFQSTEMMISD